MTNIIDLKLKDKAIITKLHLEGNDKKHLMDMGVICGTEVIVNRIAAFRGPVEILIRGYKLCIRQKDAKLIEVKKV